MNKIKKIAIILIIILNSTQIFAQSVDIANLSEQIIGKDQLGNLVSGTASDILGDVTVDNSTNLATEFSKMISRSKKYLENVFKSTTETLSKILIILVISSLALGFTSSNEINHANYCINMATSLSISSVILLDVKSVLMLCMNSIDEINVLSKGLMPSMVAGIGASGAPTTAVLHYASTMFAFDLIITLIHNVMFPFIYVYIAIITVNSAISNDILIKLADFIKWCIIGTLKIIVTAFITYISISGAVSGKADILAIKTTKFVVSSAVPVVGSIISDASESILVGASVVKNSIGVFGIFAVFSVCLVPIIYIFINFFMFKAMSVLVSIISTKNITNLLDGISESFNMAFAMICSTASILFMMMVVSIIFVGEI